MMSPRLARLAPHLLILPAAILLFAFIVLPYATIVVMSFRTPGQGTPYGEGFTLLNCIRFLSDAFYLQQTFNTLAIGFVTTVLCLLLGLPVAWQLARAAARGFADLPMASCFLRCWSASSTDRCWASGSSNDRWD